MYYINIIAVVCRSTKQLPYGAIFYENQNHQKITLLNENILTNTYVVQRMQTNVFHLDYKTLQKTGINIF